MTVEDVEVFRARVRDWMAVNLPRKRDSQPSVRPDDPSEQRQQKAQLLQRMLFDGGFGGICYPREYGGQGLTPEHQRAFNEEGEAYELPEGLNIPTMTIIAPTLLEFGTPEQLHRWLPPILRGDAVWVQFLSEPTGGSDLAGLLTRAERSEDGFVVNGSKVWSTMAYAADYALCLARTNWDVPKHRGLTMLAMKVHQPGVTINRIRNVTGSTGDFCEEFFDDVRVPADDVLGEVDDGWTVASRLLFHERQAVGGASPFAVGRGMNETSSETRLDLTLLAASVDRLGSDYVRQIVAEAHALHIVSGQLVQRVRTGMRTGQFPAPAGSLPRLMAARVNVRCADIGLEIAGAAAGAWTEMQHLGGEYGHAYLARQSVELAGGSTEMQRNMISERLLGMPREFAPDRNIPFREVKNNQSRRSAS